MQRKHLQDRRNLVAVILIAVFIIFAATYSLVTPLYEAPDEVGHAFYVFELLQSRTLPVQRVGVLGQAHQPPLYYLIAAGAAAPADLTDLTGAYRPNPGKRAGREVNASIHGSAETFPFQGQSLAVHLARGVSVLLGAITVALTIAIGRRVFPDHSVIPLLAGALVAFNPQFLFISGAISTDTLLTAAVTGMLWQLLRTLERPSQKRQWLYLGLWIAAATLAKFNGLYYGGFAALVVLIVMVRRRTLTMFVKGGLITASVVAILAGWWFVRNQVIYGDPFGMTMYQQVGFNDVRSQPLSLSDSVVYWREQSKAFSGAFGSFWGRFGWLNVRPRRWFYSAVSILSLAGLIGLGVFAMRGGLRKLSGPQKSGLALLVGACVAQQIFFMNVVAVCSYGCGQGRYFFPVIGPLMILMSIGLVGWLSQRWARLIAGGLALTMAVVAIWIPFNVIAPAYHQAALPKSSLWFIPHKTNYVFGQSIALKGYELSPGDHDSKAKLTLYWQAVQRPDFNYSAFVHVVNESGQMLAQDDHAPGEVDGYPPTGWYEGDIIADEHVIDVPASSWGSASYFRVGLYNWITGDRLSLTNGGSGTEIALPAATH